MTGSDGDKPSPRWRRVAIGGGGGMLVAMGLGRFSFTAMVPALIEAGVVSPVEAGHVGMMNLVGFLIGAILSVPLDRRFRRSRVLTATMLVCLAGLAGSAIPFGFYGLAVVRCIVGMATGVVMVLSLASIAETAPSDRRAEAASFVFGGVGLGILSSGVLVPALVAQGLAAAWVGLALAGLLGAALAVWGWQAIPPHAGTVIGVASPAAPVRIPLPLGLLMIGHALFSFGIVPHTLYWVDFIVRPLGYPLSYGGAFWTVVGVFAALGPFITAALARVTGTAWALVIAFLALGLGVGGPAVWPAFAMVIASSVVFGAQPGLSSLMAARTRDLGDLQAMPSVMRMMILANSSGSVMGGALVPWVFATHGGHAATFLLGGAAMLLGGLAAIPFGERRR